MIHILPFEHASEIKLGRETVIDGDAYRHLLERKQCRFLPNGRTGMSMVFDSLNLSPTDEIYITNTSGHTYISSCVTCTIFNFCQPSRVITSNTKAIFVIHENGVPHSRLFDLLEESRRRGIPLIEDCAQTWDSQVNGRAVGTFGDYAVFSLPKILPMREGGILVADALPPAGQCLSHTDESMLDAIEDEFHRLAIYLPYFSERRRRNFEALRKLFQDRKVLFELQTEITPFYFGVFLPNAAQIRRVSSAVQWGSTLRNDLLLIPTNPMVSSEKLVNAVNGALDNVA